MTWRSRLLAAVVADNLVDLDDDVFWNLGIYGLAIDHLGESDALVVVLSVDERENSLVDLREYLKTK